MVSSKILNAKGFAISAPPLRYFDFPVDELPDRNKIEFGIEDREFSEVKYLCTGSNALVYTGVRNKKIVGVKMLRPKQKNRNVANQEISIECRILCKLQHPNIIRIFGAGEEPRKFIIMEYLDGGTLDNLLSKQDRQSDTPGLSFSSILRIATELASSLQYLHDEVHPSATVIHRGKILLFCKQSSLNKLPTVQI